MAFGECPRKGKGRVTKWNWLKLERGKTWRGWLAGPIVGVYCHHFGGTRACPSLLTGNAVKCGHDHDKYPPEWKGYVPLWSEFGERVFVVICQDWFELAATAPHLGQVLVTKTEFHGSPIRVHPKFWAREDPPISNLDKRAQDLRPFLLRLWASAELSGYFASHSLGEMPPVLAAAQTRANVGQGEKLPPAIAERALPDTLASVLKTFEHPNGANGKKGGK